METKIVWNEVKKVGYPKKEGRYIVKAPTADPKIPFYGIGLFLPKSKKDTEWGFWCYPESFIPYITHWSELEHVDNVFKVQSKKSVAVSRRK